MTTAMRWWEVTPERSVATARILLLAVFVSMLLSTSAAVGLEFATYVAFAVCPELRRRLGADRRHPLMIGFVVFAIPIVAGAFYGAATWHDSLTAVFAWRRALLLPLAFAVFDDEPSKRLALKTILIVCVLGAAASFVSAGAMHLAGVGSIGKWISGIIFRNYATQGLTLSIGMIIALAALMRPDMFAGDRILGHRAGLASAFVLIVLDIVYILPGRSGYLSVLVMGVAIVVLLAKGSWRLKLALGAGVLAVIAALLLSSSQTRQRVALAFSEIETVDDSEVRIGTSIGSRVIFWRNTFRMVADRPVFGVGTGGFEAAYRPYVEGVEGWRGGSTGDPHNQFLKFLAEQGVIGLAAVLFFIFRSVTCPGPVPYRQIAIAVMAGWCATSLANSHFSTFVEGRLLFFCLGAMLGGAVENWRPAHYLRGRDGDPQAEPTHR